MSAILDTILPSAKAGEDDETGMKTIQIPATTHALLKQQARANAQHVGGLANQLILAGLSTPKLVVIEEGIR